jgi:DNA polymerase
MIRVPAKGPIPSRWLLVGEAPGADEEQWLTAGRFDPTPFVGASGRLLDRVLEAAGLPRGASYVTNVSKFRPPANKIEEWLTDKKAKAERNDLKHFTDGMYYNDAIKEGIQELLSDIDAVRPEVIVAMGNTPLWALTGQMGITKWRGSELWYGENTRLIPILHPAAVLRALENKPTMIHDLRVRVMDKMANPELSREPEWKFTTGRDFGRTADTLSALFTGLEDGTYLSVDIETKRGRIDCVGFARDTRSGLCVPMIDTNNDSVWGAGEEKELTGLMRAILTDKRVRVIGQNFNYDAQYFTRDPAFGFRVECSHDTKVAQHVLLPGTDKDLVTLSSLYCDWHRYWKDDLKESAVNMDDEKRWRYNCRDCAVTYEVAMKQLPMLKKEGFL